MFMAAQAPIMPADQRLEADRPCRAVYYLLGPSCLTKITCYR